MQATTESERDTFTAALWAQHGGDLPRYIAARIGEQAVAGDRGGIAFWKDIAARADTMMRTKRE